MLTPLGLWAQLHDVAAKAVELAVPELERQGCVLRLAVANYRSGDAADGEGMLAISRSVDDYCAEALTAAETSVCIGAMTDVDLLRVRSVVQSLAAGMKEVRVLASQPQWEKSSIFVDLDVDGMSDILVGHIGRRNKPVESERNDNRNAVT